MLTIQPIMLSNSVKKPVRFMAPHTSASIVGDGGGVERVPGKALLGIEHERS